ncbi:Flp pilus assembly complex ATPase component TadA [Serratia symbiotica]|uniref:ATPase, T2SS/T4P/T4SS family n=1 Tax=Serratia symbiotica TaxID=138074 RepID=UPI0020909731|nr:ATPase, T2SS/T4P/T4SS family [Serratia symbiotica]USS95888.1 Flp pilus assembly complex ATPase component TadA [Serratia symbiotica]
MIHQHDIAIDALGDDTLVRGYLEQGGVTERLARPGVTEVAINRPGEIWTETSAAGWVREGAPWLSLEMCEYLVGALVVFNHRDLGLKSPIKTMGLPDGERGTISMTFRKPFLERFTLEDYARSGRFEKANPTTSHRQTALFDWQRKMKQCVKARQFVEFFRLAVKYKLNIIIFGGTGSGKTTFAKAVVDVYPHNMRLLTIEELNEMKLPYHHHLNHVHLLYGDYVTPKDLVASCMRMKADHILLAELTGDETWYFMELINTGHPGTITTAPANSIDWKGTRVLQGWLNSPASELVWIMTISTGACAALLTPCFTWSTPTFST